MLYLDPNKEKQLTFEVDVSGDSCDNIVSHVRLFIENVEIGFPCEYKDNKIIAIIKPLRSLVKFPLKSGTIIQARLDVLSENQDYYSPWQGEIEIKSSFTIEAKLVGEDKSKKQSGKFTVKSLLEDDFSELDEIIRKSSPLQEKKSEQKIKQKKQPLLDERKSIKQQTVQKNKPVKTETTGILKSTKEKDVKIESHTKKIIKEQEKITPDKLKNITKEEVLAYMSRAGSKNPQIQEIIYEQAAKIAGSSKPFDILKEVVKIMKKKSDLSVYDMQMKGYKKIENRIKKDQKD